MLRLAARNGGYRAFAGKLVGPLGRQPSVTARAAGTPSPPVKRPRLLAGPLLPPYQGYPSETRDRRSWAILRPVGYPKSPRCAR